MYNEASPIGKDELDEKGVGGETTYRGKKKRVVLSLSLNANWVDEKGRVKKMGLGHKSRREYVQNTVCSGVREKKTGKEDKTVICMN